MSTKLYQKIDPQFKTLSSEVEVDLFDVHDNRLETLGTALLEIKYGEELLKQKFIITEGIAEPCIFGMNGIEDHGFCQNGRDKIIFRLKPTETFGPNGSTIILDKRIKLPPSSSSIFLLTDDNDSKTDLEVNQINRVGEKIRVKEIQDGTNLENCAAKNITIKNEIEKNEMKGTLKNKTDSNKVEIAKQVEKLPPDNGSVKSAKTQMECQTKNVENRQEVNKKVMYRVDHATELHPQLKIIPFQYIIDGKRHLFAELHNDSEDVITLQRKKKIAVVKDFEIWDSEISNSRKVNAINEIDLSKMEDTSRAPLRILLQEFCDIFSEQGYDIGKTDVIEHLIDTGKHRPIRLRPYRTPHKLKEEMQNHIKEMLKNDIITPSTSPWAAPALLVPKNDGSFRFVVDYRALNAVTKFDSYPMPRIHDILDQLKNKRYFTCLDLASGYHNVCVDPESREKTAFVVEHGLYEYKRLPFGLVSAPASFSRLMDHILRDHLGIFILVYLDDILIYSDNAEDHLKHLRIIFNILRKAKLKLKGKKCQFFLKEVTFLGHVITQEGIKPDPGKIEKIMNFKTPTTVKQTQSFLGLASYYRRFVENFSKIAHPLIELTKKKNEKDFNWGEDQQKAFEILQRRLTNPPILSYPNWENFSYLLMPVTLE